MFPDLYDIIEEKLLINKENYFKHYSVELSDGYVFNKINIVKLLNILKIEHDARYGIHIMGLKLFSGNSQKFNIVLRNDNYSYSQNYWDDMLLKDYILSNYEITEDMLIELEKWVIECV